MDNSFWAPFQIDDVGLIFSPLTMDADLSADSPTTLTTPIVPSSAPDGVNADEMTIDYGDELPMTMTTLATRTEIPLQQQDTVVLDTEMQDEAVPIVDEEDKAMDAESDVTSMTIEASNQDGDHRSEYPIDIKSTQDDDKDEIIVTSPMTAETMERIPSIDSHPGFRSPPHIAVSRDELQISALGHSAVVSPLETYTGQQQGDGTNPVITSKPQSDTASDSVHNDKQVSQSHQEDDINHDEIQRQARHDLDRSKALATQHQHRSDGSLSQDQMVEHLGVRRVRIAQEQSMTPEPSGTGPDEPAIQENEVTIRQVHSQVEGEPDEVRVDTKQHSTGGTPHWNGKDNLQQFNEVNVYRQGTDLSTSDGIFRPVLDIQPLAALNVFVNAGGQVGDESSSYIPSLELIAGDRVYSVFSAGDADPTQDPDLPVILDGDDEARSLYYGPIEAFTDALRSSLDDIDADSEIVLNFEWLGLKLSEVSRRRRVICARLAHETDHWDATLCSTGQCLCSRCLALRCGTTAHRVQMPRSAQNDCRKRCETISFSLQAAHRPWSEES